jgi:nucleotide-binding universal stress UspA family protein
MGTLVCAVDDSPEAEEALRVAARVSREADLRLVVVHVEDPGAVGSGVRGAAQPRARRLLDGLLDNLQLGRGVDKRVEVGPAAEELARVAAEEAATMVLLGSPRRRWRRRRVSRLTGEFAATAGCPVVVVPPAPRH